MNKTINQKETKTPFAKFIINNKSKIPQTILFMERLTSYFLYFTLDLLQL